MLIAAIELFSSNSQRHLVGAQLFSLFVARRLSLNWGKTCRALKFKLCSDKSQRWEKMQSERL